MRLNNLLKLLIVVLVVTSVDAQAVAQDFTISGEFRPRTELRAGFQKPLTDDLNPAMVIQNRTRLQFDYGSERIVSRFTIQDSRVWGQSSQKSNNIPLTIFEGWAQFFITPQFSLTVGRQGIAYDHNRLFTVTSWDNNGKSHDLALLKYTDINLGLRVDAGFAVNQPSAVNEETPFNDSQSYYQRLGYVRAEKNFNGRFNASAIVVAESFQNLQLDIPSGDYYVDGHYGRYTAGVNFSITDKEMPLGLLLTAYYQFGKSYGATTMQGIRIEHKDLGAYLLAAKVSYKVAKPASVYLGADVYSGSDENATDDNTWNKLYGSNHSYNGSMEYWRTLPNAGLLDYFGGVKFSLYDKKITADASFHLFSLQKSMSGLSGKNLGSELDVKLQYKVVDDFALECGWSTYFNSDNTKLIKGLDGVDTRFQQWAYVMLTINPQLFSTKKEQ